METPMTGKLTQARRSKQGGFTLIEVSLAMGLFAILMAVTAQALLGFSLTMQVQEQRNEALAHCRGVLAQMRQDRDNSVLPFPQQVLQLWPNNFQTQNPAVVRLPNEVLRVTYANVNADPLRVTVTSTWTDMQGRQLQVSLSSMLTGQNR